MNSSKVRTLLGLCSSIVNNRITCQNHNVRLWTQSAIHHHIPSTSFPLRNLTTKITPDAMEDHSKDVVTINVHETVNVNVAINAKDEVIPASAPLNLSTTTTKNGSVEQVTSLDGVNVNVDVNDVATNTGVESLPASEGVVVVAQPPPPPEERKAFVRRRKMVLMLSYCGQAYLGMQKNPGMKTIEDDLHKALFAAGYIDQESLKLPRIMQFQRAARTDKAVSAARQIVSLKTPDVVEVANINAFLPPEIRVMGAKRVTKGFCCKSNCDARTYMYMIPTFAFTPVDQNVTEDYRISPEVLESLREILKVYLGTKNFHNFTSKRKPTDPSSKRYIISFTASDPFVKDGLEYLILRVKGQSFMLHQIRKMIGLVVAYMRGFAGSDTFSKAWELVRIDIPKAPGVGLVLDQVHYERYNQKYGSDGVHATLTWDEVGEEVEKFCQTFIYPVITKVESEEKSMFEWLATLPYHTYDEREQGRNVPIMDQDCINESPKEYSGIGKAALAAIDKGAPILGMAEEGGDDESGDEDEDSSDGVKIKRKGKKVGEEDDDDDNEFVAAELAKRRRVH